MNTMFFHDLRRLVVASILAGFTVTGAASLLAEENEVKADDSQFVFDTGAPPWKGERILLPPGFARDLGWNGVEEIRFAPGMFEAEQPDFFSYVLVFLLKPGADISEEGLQRELLTYYAGLSEAVMESRGLEVDTSGFAVLIEEEEKSSGAPKAAPEAVSWKATLDWVEPFATREEQRLYLGVLTWEHDGQPVVLSLVSPVETDDEAENSPWAVLRNIRERFCFE